MALGEYLGAGAGITKGLYHLNGNATDSSGNGNNGTATNVTWVGGTIGSGSASFNGTTSVISCGDVALGTSGLTISAWIYRTGTIGDYSGIVSKGTGSTASNEFSLQFGGAATSGINKIGFDIIDSSSNGTYLQDTSITIALNTWYNIIGVFNPSTYQKIYINGVEVASTNSTRANFRNGTNPLEIGRQYQTNSRIFNGFIDECIVENIIWSANEIKKYYSYSKGRFSTI